MQVLLAAVVVLSFATRYLRVRDPSACQLVVLFFFASSPPTTHPSALAAQCNGLELAHLCRGSVRYP